MFIKRELCKKIITDENKNIKDIISKIEDGGLKIALILNKNNQIIGYCKILER